MRYERRSTGAHGQISHQTMLLSILLFLVFTIAGSSTAGAQIAVVPSQGAQSDHPFLVPFEVVNRSSSPLHIELESPKAWMNLELAPGASRSLHSHLIESETLPDEVDTVVVIDVRSSDYLSSDRQYFHFVGHGDSVRDWTWISEPSDSVQAEVDNAVWFKTQRGVRGAETK
jgi:hypothetical protein